MITGTVSGTVIKVLRADNDNLVLAQDNTANRNQAPPFPFTLSNIPINVPLRIFFITGGAIYPLYFGSSPTNIFTFTTGGTIDLGLVTTANSQATPQFPPNNVTFGAPNQTIPSTIVPPPATITITSPTDGVLLPGGPTDIKFTIQDFVLGGQHQDHLHIYLDSDTTPYEFQGGSPGQVLYGNSLAVNAQWVSNAQIRFASLQTGPHIVRFKLATASHSEYVNSEASTQVQFTTEAPPPTPETVTITSPTNNQSLPAGPITISFTTQNFTIGGQGQPQLHFYLDTDPVVYQFLNGSSNGILYNGSPATGVQRISSISFALAALSPGLHTVKLVLASGDAPSTELSNASATAIVAFSVATPVGTPTITVTSPQGGSSVPAGPVFVSFSTGNFTIGLAGAPHLHFYVDSDPTVYEFFNGAGINSDNGVLYNGTHTHFVHWNSGTSFQMFALAAGSHQVRLVLADVSHVELQNAEATKSLSFTITAPTGGEIMLQPVLTGLAFPTAMAVTPAPDNRIFFVELATHTIRYVDAGWQNPPVIFAQVDAVAWEFGSENGLLGIALDPNFSNNGFVYAYRTHVSGTKNQVVRFKEVNGAGTQETVILDDLPARRNHSGGKIQFGPDGKLFIVVGDAEQPDLAQDLNFLGGKILRINADGSIPNDNPFSGSPVYSHGHRNSFGITFHPVTGNLWQTENGPDDNDEINRIQAGHNYGWNTVHGIANNPDFTDPIAVFFAPPCSPCTIAPTGIIAIHDNPHYPPSFQNNLLFAAFNGGPIWRLELDSDTLTHLAAPPVASYLGGQGGLLDLVKGPDGFIYVSGLDAIYRVVVP